MSKHLLTGPRRYAEMGGGTNPPVSEPIQNQNTQQYNPSFTQPTHQYDQAAQSPFQNQSKTQGQFGFNQTATPNQQTNYYQGQEAHDYQQDPSAYQANKQAATGYGNKNVAAPTSDQKQRRRSSKSKQIDTDKIPRPDINAESSYNPASFVTSSTNNPPHSYTSFITTDDGNAGPRFVRSTFYKVPLEESMVNQTHVPLGLVIQPLADPGADEEGVLATDYGEAGPFRCNRCRAYVNPNWIFTKQGSVAVCNICKMNNEVPKEYYSPLDASGQRQDKYERLELHKGVYEFIAPSSYHNRAVVTPNILFCIEVSSTTYLSGILHQICSSLQSLLDYIPSPELTKICIVTYDTGVNFFRVPDDLNKDIQIVHVPDIETSCLPYPKNYFFLSLANEREKINYLIEKILKYYESNEKVQKGNYKTCFGAALIDCCDLLLQDGGRVLMFATQAPVNGVGKIKRRDDYKLSGTDKEKTLYVSQSEEYQTWAKRCLEKRVSVDLFCFCPDYFDLVTIGQISGTTGGNIYFYSSYRPQVDGERFHYDLSRNLTRYVGSDAIMTIRTCQGIAFLDYITPVGRRPVPEIEFSNIDADTTINAFFKHDEKLTGDDVTFQVAMLYTNPYGQRVIRVLNYKIPTSNDIVAIFKSFDVEAVSQLIIKRNIIHLSTLQVFQIRKTLQDLLVNILYAYRHHCASTSSPSQLILPESLKVLPVFVLAAFKAHVLRLRDVKPDDRAFDMFNWIKMPLNALSNLLYPKMYPLHTIWTEEEYSPGTALENGRVVLGSNIATTDEKIDDNGIYLIDNSETLFLYVKRGVDPIFLQHLFGVETYQEVASLTSLPEYIESEYFTKVSNIIDQLRRNKNGSYQPVRIVTEKDPFEQGLLNLLVEDERNGEAYSTFLVNSHKMIQEKMS